MVTDEDTGGLGGGIEQHAEMASPPLGNHLFGLFIHPHQRTIHTHLCVTLPDLPKVSSKSQAQDGGRSLTLGSSSTGGQASKICRACVVQCSPLQAEDQAATVQVQEADVQKNTCCDC